MKYNVGDIGIFAIASLEIEAKIIKIYPNFVQFDTGKFVTCVNFQSGRLFREYGRFDDLKFLHMKVSDGNDAVSN